MPLSEKLNSIIKTRQQVVIELSELTVTSENSVYRWLNGTLTPSPIKQKIIADYFSTTVEELFPGKKKSKKRLCIESNG